MTEQLLKETPVPGGFGSTVGISDEGRNWFNKNKNLTKPSYTIEPNSALAPFLQYSKTVSKNSSKSTHIVTIKSPTQLSTTA